jgi:hypothetical protein
MKNQADLLVKHAERESKRARASFLATLAEIRHRTDPRVIAAELAEDVVGRANQMLDDTTTSIRKRPALPLGGLAAFAIAVGLRLWLAKSKVDSDAT